MKKHLYDSGTVLSAYQKIRNELLNELSLNKFKVGDSFYSENTLASRFKVARLTVRNALQTLENDGYLYRRQGRGAFIASLPKKPQKVKITNHCAIGVLPGKQGLKDRILIMEFIQEFYEHAAKRGFMLYLGRNNADSFIEAKVDGVVVLNTLDEKNITALKQADIPVVSLFGRNTGLFPDISNSPINTGEKTCRYLYGLGHQKIVFVAGDSIDAMKVERTYRSGALKAMAEIGIPTNRYQALMGADCHYKLKKLLCSPNHGVDALFVHWESLLPVMNVLDSLSIKIPDDISVVSQGERILYTHTNPLITLVRPDLNAAAALALDCLEQMMRESKGTNHEFNIKDKSYDLYIDERGSCRDRRRKTQNKIQQGRK